MKAAQSRIGKKLFSNEKTGRELLKRIHDAGKNNPHVEIKVKMPDSQKSTKNKQVILREG